MLGYFANWGTSLHISNSSALQWIDPTSMHICFAGIILVMSLFALESPRYLCKQGMREKAAVNLSKLRRLPTEHPYVRSELIDIDDQLERERTATMGAGWIGPLRELFLIKSNRYRILLTLGSQLLARKLFCPLSLYEYILTCSRMERSKLDHYLRATVLRAPWYQRPNRKALRNGHFRCREVCLCAYLCLPSCRFHWPKALSQHWNLLAVHLRPVHRYLPQRCSIDQEWRGRVCFSQTCRHWGNCLHLPFWCRMGSGLELYSVSYRS